MRARPPQVKPTFVPELSSEGDTKYFPAKTDAKSLADTIVPEYKQIEIKQNEDCFKDFEKGANIFKKK